MRVRRYKWKDTPEQIALKTFRKGRNFQKKVCQSIREGIIFGAERLTTPAVLTLAQMVEANLVKANGWDINFESHIARDIGNPHVECKHWRGINPTLRLEEVVEKCEEGETPIVYFQEDYQPPYVLMRATDFSRLFGRLIALVVERRLEEINVTVNQPQAATPTDFEKAGAPLE